MAKTYRPYVPEPGLPPGRYFRLLPIGYFEGSDAERAIRGSLVAANVEPEDR
jgi:hypothetical protein